MPNDTQIPAARVAIAENDLPSRPWFRFFNSLYNFIGLGAGAVPPTSGGTGLTTYAAGDLLYAPSANTLARLAPPGAANASYLGTDGTNMPQWIQVAYGQFLDTTNQTIAANTPTPITFNTTVYDTHVSIGTPTSRIVLANSGVHNIQFSLQLANPSAAEEDFVVWLRVNGTDFPLSGSTVTVQKKHGALDGTYILALNIFYTFVAGQYFELCWITTNGNGIIRTIIGTANYPTSPGVILTVNQVI